MTSLYEIDGDGVRLTPHLGQLRAWDSRARIIAMIAGSQGGKTSFGPWWLEREISWVGAGDYLAATSSYDLFKLKMLPALREVFEHVLGIGRYWSGSKIIEIADPHTGQFAARRVDDPMYARIILRSAAAKGGMEAATAKAAWLDEAGQDEFPLTVWEAVQRRLTLSLGRVLLTTTLYNLGWVKQQILDQDGHGGIEVVQFESIENPAFPREEFERLRDTMPTWKFNMFMRGLAERPPGMIYSDFVHEYRERGGHLVKPFDLPSDWPRFVGVDPGVINTCLVWLAAAPDGDLFAFREQLGGRKSAEEHARAALELAAADGALVKKWAVGAKSEIYHREDWLKAGARNVVEPDYAAVEARIDKVIGLLRLNRLFFFDTLTGTLDQLGTYARVLDSAGEPTPEIKDKARFHFLDALGYAALALGKRGRRKLDVSTSRWA